MYFLSNNNNNLIKLNYILKQNKFLANKIRQDLIKIYKDQFIYFHNMTNYSSIKVMSLINYITNYIIIIHYCNNNIFLNTIHNNLNQISNLIHYHDDYALGIYQISMTFNYVNQDMYNSFMYHINCANYYKLFLNNLNIKNLQYYIFINNYNKNIFSKLYDYLEKNVNINVSNENKYYLNPLSADFSFIDAHNITSEERINFILNDKTYNHNYYKIDNKYNDIIILDNKVFHYVNVFLTSFLILSTISFLNI